MPSNNRNSKKQKAQIHCPVSGCLFAEGSERHFTDKKFLNQHIAKVHAEKRYVCTKCQKSFGLDWWRKHHEKTCGMIWKCDDCGVQYSSRESLLTHLRRTQHKRSECMASNDKLKQTKATIKTPESPVILLIQPIIQNINCMQPFQTSAATPRRILPKSTQPILLTLPIPVGLSSPVPTSNSAPTVIPEQRNKNTAFNPMHEVRISNVFTLSTPPKQTDYTKGNIVRNADCQKTVSTQTVDSTGDFCSKRHQSQASQCSRRKPKSLKVGIESHTQTAESAVTKIKKKKSRRKSVPITKDTSVLTDEMLGIDNSFWPGFQDFVLQHADLGTRLFKNSTSTQTQMINNKTLCDSETLTDKDLLNFSWEDTMKADDKHIKCDPDFQLMSDMNHVEHNAIPVDIDNNIQDLNILSESTLSNFSEIKTSCGNNQSKDIPTSNLFASTSECQNTTLPCTSDEKCSVFSVFGKCDKSETDNKAPHPPTLSDIHTQTMASSMLDYNLLTNMETQTTDDFNFSYLEFSDTETQTLWEDFPNIDDSPLEADQLSIEIQTDFSSFGTGLNFDPYELFNSVDVQTMLAGCPSKETAGVNSETQTLDKFYFPQFTNSEAQTLEMSDFMFES